MTGVIVLCVVCLPGCGGPSATDASPPEPDGSAQASPAPLPPPFRFRRTVGSDPGTTDRVLREGFEWGLEERTPPIELQSAVGLDRAGSAGEAAQAFASVADASPDYLAKSWAIWRAACLLEAQEEHESAYRLFHRFFTEQAITDRQRGESGMRLAVLARDRLPGKAAEVLATVGPVADEMPNDREYQNLHNLRRTLKALSKSAPPDPGPPR